MTIRLYRIAINNRPSICYNQNHPYRRETDIENIIGAIGTITGVLGLALAVFITIM